MRGGTPFSITETVESDGVIRLAIAGELDLATRSAVQRRLVELRPRGGLVRLDLSKVEFVDASGLTVLIGAIRDTTQPHLRVQVADDVAPQVSRLLAAVGCELD